MPSGGHPPHHGRMGPASCPGTAPHRMAGTTPGHDDECKGSDMTAWHCGSGSMEVTTVHWGPPCGDPPVEQEFRTCGDHVLDLRGGQPHSRQMMASVHPSC